jgi:hypothetical protein
MKYDEGDPIPPGYHQDTRIRKGLVIAGAVTFGSLYLTTILITAGVQGICDADGVSGDCDEASALYVPAIGPFIAIGTLDANAPAAVFLAINGLGQSAGVAMLVAGLAARENVLVRDDISKPAIHVRPLVAGDALGLGLDGTF